MQGKYKKYTTDDFILDDDFREIVGKDDLEKLLQAYPEKKREVKLAARIVRGLHPGGFHQPEERKQKLWLQVIYKKRKREARLTWFRYAASILLLVGIGIAVFHLARQEDAGEVLVEATTASNDAMLILDNGKKVAITSKESTIHYSPDGSGIVVNDSSQIAHSVSPKSNNQLIVPYGKRSFITLSDGTKVWLNSGSRLTFPSVFTGESREVVMEGEAYFDVASSKAKPFYVKTDVFKMKVYGTKFNVQAYQQDNGYNIVLVEGKVGLSSDSETYSNEVFLAPNQKASIVKGNPQFEVADVEDTEMYTAWKDGYLTFTNDEVADVLKKVSRYYNVVIEANFPDDVEHIYGKLELKDDVERVLDGVAFISKTNYKKQGDMYLFFK